MTTAPLRQPQKWPALDGLRTLAVVAVLLNHGTYGLFPAGFLGVDLFFVLSGFLITHLLLKEWVRTGAIDYRRFLERRALRLLPALVVAILLAGALWKIGEVEPASWPWSWAALATLFGVANFILPHMNKLEHAWSLGVETQFYFLWPLILAAGLRINNRRKLLWLCGLAAILSGFLRLDLLAWGVSGLTLFSFPLCRTDALLFGALIALLPWEKSRALAQKWTAWRLPIFLLGAILPFLHSFDMTAPFLYRGGFTISAFLFALVVWFAIHLPENSREGRLLGSPFCQWAASRSYGIYLYHYPIFLALEALRQPGNRLNFLLVSVLRFGLSILLAEASFRWLETPFLRLRTSL